MIEIRKFFSFAEIICPLVLCASCFLQCYEEKEPETYYIVVSRAQYCECPICRHRPKKI